MSGMKHHPEWLKYLAALPPAPPPKPLKDIYELREQTTKVIANWASSLPRPADVQENYIVVTSYDGAKIALTHHTTTEYSTSAIPLPAVLHLHGGGLVASSAKDLAPAVANLSKESGFPYFAVEYRLAPEHPAPAAVEDCYASLQYLIEHAAELNIDPAKIVVMGESAGGGLAAGVTLLARDRKLNPPVARQVLVYPMLDDRTELPPDAALHQFLNWRAEHNIWSWTAYLGNRRGREDADISPYEVPARAKDLRGLPPTYIDVGGLDLFRDEAITFAANLARAEVDVEFHLFPGVPHGWDGAPTDTALTARKLRLKVIKNVLEP
ncbi:Esterase LipI [Paramyrothecium foliicola]|nr:Esterase LipI [Paramyrothecium foliicola]